MMDQISTANRIARERATPCHAGLISMAVGGRTDHIPMNVLEGSYVLPADIVSGLGEGNTLAGAKLVDNMYGHHSHLGDVPHKAGGGSASFSSKPVKANLKSSTDLPADIALMVDGKDFAGSDLIKQLFGSGPFGISDKLPQFAALPRPSAPTDIPSLSSQLKINPLEVPAAARGGPIMSGKYRPVPIVAAGGEYVIHPDVVQRLGNGDMEKGHNYLDHFVKYVRKHLVKTLSKLPGPRRD
jgi:hypothetical protein